MGVAWLRYPSDDGTLRSIRQAWTSVADEDPFVRVSAGRSPFRVSDLLALAALLESLDGDACTVRESDGGAETVKEILPNM